MMGAFIFAYKAALLALSIVVLMWMYREDNREREAGKMAIDRTLKVGDKVRYLGGDDDADGGELTEGRSYVVEDTYGDGDAIIKNDKVGFWVIGKWNAHCFELVTESTQSTADLIANLALRVSELERAQSKRKEGDDMAVNGEYRAEKRRAKVGERIVVVNPRREGLSFERGDTFTVKSVNLEGVITDIAYVYHDEYEVLPADMPQSERNLDGLLAQVTEENKHRADKPAQIRDACDELRDLLIRKNHDYGDSFAQQYAKYGLMSAMIRMDDKMRRLETLVDGEQAQVAESIEDTLTDLAGYALLALVEARAER